MLTASILKPYTTISIGDYWYCLADRNTYEFGLAAAHGIPQWGQLAPGTFMSQQPPPPPSTLGAIHDIWINSIDVNRVPHQYDSSGNTWIPIVDPTFKFPPLSPSIGDTWTDSNTQVQYGWAGRSWTQTNLPTAGGFSNTLSSNLSLSVATNPTSLMTLAAPHANTVISITGLIDIHRDGTLVYSSTYTPDDAAKQFWQAMSEFCPQIIQEKQLNELACLREKVKYAETRGFKFPKPQNPVDPKDAWDAAMGVVG